MLPPSSRVDRSRAEWLPTMTISTVEHFGLDRLLKMLSRIYRLVPDQLLDILVDSNTSVTYSRYSATHS